MKSQSGSQARYHPWSCPDRIFIIFFLLWKSSNLVFSGESVETVEAALEVDRVWSGHPVGFALLTHKNRQFVAFYDEYRHLTIAARRLEEKIWRFARIPESLGWDS